ncbi:MAG: hypothetical protein SOV16_08305 [Anaerobiospirillum succiniciproducens]|nr:hypothetical protein [Anaerobiospirillum succiniciproducens]MDY2799142.1 hypothetical protein [Anaerobiospirillum succiniciproducens]
MQIGLPFLLLRTVLSKCAFYGGLDETLDSVLALALNGAQEKDAA